MVNAGECNMYANQGPATVQALELGQASFLDD